MMEPLRKIVVRSLLALFFMLLVGSGVSAKAASYDNNTLEDYGIPDNVIQVILDNSLSADGNTPTQDQKTPSTFTIADVTKLKTISLATRTKQDDGSYKSTVNGTVADWVAGGAAGSLYDVSPNVYGQNTEDKVTGDNGSLATKALVFDGHTLTEQYHPPFNMLMQIIATASNATTVDLTGVTSQVDDTTLAQSLVSLLQTNRLTSINALLLGSNNLTDLKSYLLDQTVMNVTDSQQLTTLDLSNNNMTEMAWGQSFSIIGKLTNLNLAGNKLATISGTLNDMLTAIVKNAGKGDLSSSNLKLGDWNTLQDIIAVLNADSGLITLSDDSINAIVTSQPGALNDRAIENAITQLDDTSISKLLSDNKNLSDEVQTKLQEQQAKGDGSSGGVTPTAENSVAVTGGPLDFGTVPIDGLGTAIGSSGSLEFNATVLPGSEVTAKMTSWRGQDGKLVQW